MQALFTVSGRVQRVWYRAFVKEHADRLHLFGYAKNCDNGDVEIAVQGDASAIVAFKELCKKGSAIARVDSIVEKKAKRGSFSSFDIM